MGSRLIGVKSILFHNYPVPKGDIPYLPTHGYFIIAHWNKEYKLAKHAMGDVFHF